MVPYTKELDLEQKHNLKQVGKKFIFTIKNLDPADAGLYQVDVEGVPVFSTDFKSEEHPGLDQVNNAVCMCVCGHV